MNMRNEIAFRLRHVQNASHMDKLMESVAVFQEKIQTGQSYSMQEWTGFLSDYAILRGIAEVHSSNHFKPDFFQSEMNELAKKGITPQQLNQCKSLVASFAEGPVKNSDDLIHLFSKLGSPALANTPIHKPSNR